MENIKLIQGLAELIILWVRIKSIVDEFALNEDLTEEGLRDLRSRILKLSMEVCNGEGKK